VRKARWRGCVDASLVLAGETALFLFFARSGPWLGSVDFSHPQRWLATVSPQGALTALVRLLGLAVSGWLLTTTVAYALAVWSGRRSLLRGARPFTLPALRRVLDAAATASMVAASFGTSASAASALPVPPPVAIVQPLHPWRVMETVPGPPPAFPPARVSSSAIGRHFPHPGVIAHVPPAAGAVAERKGTGEVPSQANGFAGLEPGTKVVVVQPGDCLSVLAERHLGDWRLDTEIEALNWGRLQPDGRALVDDHWIYPGWVLIMPPQATGTIVVGEAGPGEASRHRLAHTARRAGPELAPGGPRAGAAGEASSPRGGSRPSPPGGSEARRPATAGPPAETGATAVPPGPPSTVGARGATDPGKVKVPEAAAGSRPATTAGTSGPPQRPVTSSDSNGRPHHGSARHHGNPGLAAIVGAGAVAAAGIIWRLDRHRREQMYARRKGAPIARNRPEVEAAERRARAIASPEALRWVDLGMRYLSGLVGQAFREGAAAASPVLTIAGEGGLEVVVGGEELPALGWFRPLAGGGSLVLDPDISLEDLEVLAGDHWSAWPALVNLGQASTGTVLLNLEQAGSLSVEGSTEDVQDVLAAIALQLASQPWSDEMLAGLYALGRCPLDERLGGLERVADHQAADLAARLGLVSVAHRQQAGAADLGVLRASTCEALPNVVVAFAASPGPAVASLVQAAEPASSGVAVVAKGPCAGTRWRLTLTDEGKGLLQGEVGSRSISLALRLDYGQKEVVLLSEAMGATAEREAGHGDGREDGNGAVGRAAVGEGSGPGGRGGEEVASAGAGAVIDIRDGAGYPGPVGPAPGVPGPAPSVPRGAVEVRVLGPVDLVGSGTGSLEPSRRAPALAALAYLATRERPVAADELGGALWPLDLTKDDLSGPQRKTIMNVVSRARAVLGYGEGGEERLAHGPQGYYLAPDVTCDWARFCRLERLARRQGPAESMATMHQALELVRGEPFAGSVTSHFFEWVSSEHLDLIICAKVADAAQDLGQAALAAGDYAEATWAVEKGLQMDPAREELFQIWMHALGRCGQAGAVDRVYRRLRLVLQRRINPLHEPREESRAIWRLYTANDLADV